MAVVFYNVRKRKRVSIDESELSKCTYPRETSKGLQLRYAFKAHDNDGMSLTKFVTKEHYDSVDAPIVDR
jgi:hypothetical protein